jgi:nitroimidazol reductase NimA-like FMN-containing flavoprotein (pyridoxamine 5'-phosphate oxidase superfamily)
MRAVTDREALYALLADCTHVHVATPAPMALPMVFARIGDTLYLHGAVGNALLRGGRAEDTEVCLVATRVDGLVLARSAMHHSMNYRSAVVFGRLREVETSAEKRAALDAIVNHALPGRAEECRPASEAELRVTRVVALSLAEASVKIRSAGPVDDEDDLPLPHWAGVLPLVEATLAPEPDAAHPVGTPTPPPSVVAARLRRAPHLEPFLMHAEVTFSGDATRLDLLAPAGLAARRIVLGHRPHGRHAGARGGGVVHDGGLRARRSRWWRSRAWSPTAPRSRGWPTCSCTATTVGAASRRCWCATWWTTRGWRACAGSCWARATRTVCTRPWASSMVPDGRMMQRTTQGCGVQQHPDVNRAGSRLAYPPRNHDLPHRPAAAAPRRALGLAGCCARDASGRPGGGAPRRPAPARRSALHHPRGGGGAPGAQLVSRCRRGRAHHRAPARCRRGPGRAPGGAGPPRGTHRAGASPRGRGLHLRQ